MILHLALSVKLLHDMKCHPEPTSSPDPTTHNVMKDGKNFTTSVLKSSQVAHLSVGRRRSHKWGDVLQQAHVSGAAVLLQSARRALRGGTPHVDVARQAAAGTA